MAEHSRTLHSAHCPSRRLFHEITDKWSMLILFSLAEGPLRFNAVKRCIEGITQKALTQSLRRLERNGLVARRVVTRSPVAVEYRLTPLGRSLDEPFRALHVWTLSHCASVERARQAFDAHEPTPLPPRGAAS